MECRERDPSSVCEGEERVLLYWGDGGGVQLAYVPKPFCAINYIRGQ
jgi:hypothetical protein